MFYVLFVVPKLNLTFYVLWPRSEFSLKYKSDIKNGIKKTIIREEAAIRGIMGQDQSYVSHAGVAPIKKYQDKYEDPLQYRVSNIEYRSSDYDRKDYKRHKARRSDESFKSDNSSTESSGYRSGSSAYECSDRSSSSDYFSASLYKNDHYKNANKELYRPIKIPKDKRYKQLFEKEELKSARLKGYLSETEKAKLKAVSSSKKAGIRNYTPKIISAEEQRKKLDNWI